MKERARELFEHAKKIDRTKIYEKAIDCDLKAAEDIKLHNAKGSHNHFHYTQTLWVYIDNKEQDREFTDDALGYERLQNFKK